MFTLSRFKRLTASVMAVVMVLTLGSVIEPAASAASSITITASSTQVTLEIGEEKAIVLAAAEDDIEIGEVTDDAVWTSEDESIATVTNGIISGVGEGNVKIRANYVDSIHGIHSIIIEVTVNPLLERIELEGLPSIELPMGSISNPIIKAYYLDQSYPSSIQMLGTWTSSNENVVTASDGTLTPEGIGEAVVTFTYSGKEIELFVEVIHGVIGERINDAEPTLQIDDTFQIEMKGIYSDDSIIDIDQNDVNYFGYDNTIISISPSGMITALAEGETVILAIYSIHPPMEIKVTVVSAPKVVSLSISGTS